MASRNGGVFPPSLLEPHKKRNGRRRQQQQLSLEEEELLREEEEMLAVTRLLKTTTDTDKIVEIMSGVTAKEQQRKANGDGQDTREKVEDRAAHTESRTPTVEDEDHEATVTRATTVVDPTLAQIKQFFRSPVPTSALDDSDVMERGMQQQQRDNNDQPQLDRPRKRMATRVAKKNKDRKLAVKDYHDDDGKSDDDKGDDSATADERSRLSARIMTRKRASQGGNAAQGRELQQEPTPHIEAATRTTDTIASCVACLEMHGKCKGYPVCERCEKLGQSCERDEPPNLLPGSVPPSSRRSFGRMESAASSDDGQIGKATKRIRGIGEPYNGERGGGEGGYSDSADDGGLRAGKRSKMAQNGSRTNRQNSYAGSLPRPLRTRSRLQSNSKPSPFVEKRPVVEIEIEKGSSVMSKRDCDDSNDNNEHSIETTSTKKIYLKSGLYSVDLKQNHQRGARRIASVQVTKLAGRRGQRPHFFQLPINYGEVLMNQQRDFYLPWDIMNAWETGTLNSRKQPEPYIKIRGNIFVERKRRTAAEIPICHCKLPPDGKMGCGEDCFNRVMFYECSPQHCRCGDKCSNQRFQRKETVKDLEVYWTNERGFGLRTLTPIKKGNLVIEYRGEVISQKLCIERMEGIYRNRKNFYFLEYEKGEVVDASMKGTDARFVNHSCEPNCQIEKWKINGEMAIGLFALQDIPKGAEVFYDYNFETFGGGEKQKCFCGARSCRGVIGGRNMAKSVVAAADEGKKKNAKRKKKAGRKVQISHEAPSRHWSQLPTLRQRRQKAEKYAQQKMNVIRIRKLFLFRNIRSVEAKYLKRAQTKSRGIVTESAQPTYGSTKTRKRTLETIVEDLKLALSHTRTPSPSSPQGSSTTLFGTTDSDDLSEGSGGPGSVYSFD